LGCGGAYRRDAQYLAYLQPVRRCDALAVDPDLSAAQNAIDMAFGHAFEVARQKIVYTLPVATFIHGEHGHGIFAYFCHLAYTCCLKLKNFWLILLTIHLTTAKTIAIVSRKAASFSKKRKHTRFPAHFILPVTNLEIFT
jgi:hypothetical protein